MSKTFSPADYVASAAWPFVEAKRVMAHHEAKLKAGAVDKGYVLFETGYGPSGLPHIGTFGEVFRTGLVRFAFEKLYPGVKTRLFAFSDDMDGLRKVPDNLPNFALLKANLHKPLTRVPDPFEKYESFAAHNNAMLRDFLDRFGFDYEFLSSTEQYTTGVFNPTLRKVLERHQQIVDIIVPTLGAERAATYSPFLPVCPSTGHVLQVPVVATNVDAATLTYEHNGKKVETSVLDGHCKLQWKADWAMRWAHFGVDYEMSGKDLIDSVLLGSAICLEIGAQPPVNLTYEHFVDEQGAKISKSKGNGLTIEEWLRFGPPESLSLFMYKTPTRQKRLFKSLVPVTVAEYCDLLTQYDTQDAAARLENPVWHIHKGNPPANPLPFDYGMLLNLVSVTAATEPSVVWRYLKRYKPELSPETHPALNALIEGAIAYFGDTIKPTQAYKTPADGQEKDALRAVDGYLATLTGAEAAEDIQTGFYELGKAHYGKERLRDWFKLIYSSLLGFEQGPRLGTFVLVYGVAETRELVAAALQRA